MCGSQRVLAQCSCDQDTKKYRLEKNTMLENTNVKKHAMSTNQIIQTATHTCTLESAAPSPLHMISRVTAIDSGTSNTAISHCRQRG